MSKILSGRIRRLWLLPLLVVAGCSTGDEDSPERIPAETPQQLMIEGHNWTRKASVSSPDEKLLSGWFQQNPSVADNPLVQGQPTPYEYGSSRRFYWVSAADSRLDWFYVEFQENRFVTAGEGQGEPFSATK